jgi:purine nucleoside permease
MQAAVGEGARLASRLRLLARARVFARRGANRPPQDRRARTGRVLMRWKRGRLSVVLAILAALWGMASAEAAPMKPIEVRVVIVTTWESYKDGRDNGGELYAWRTQWPLTTTIAFPAGVHSLQYDPKTHVLAVLTGMATARATASIMALGLDPRFDLTHAYWIVAGTAGVDPKAASAGSTAWARFVVDGDLNQELDARDMPADWPIGVVPYDRSTPYEEPPPPMRSDSADVVWRLNRRLVDWAYARTRATVLNDDGLLQKLRAPYDGPGARAPFVLEADGLISARTWYGERLNVWARRWVDYWTHGEGVFAMSAEEDAGVLQALDFLARAKRADRNRVLILRAASDYTLNPSGESAAQFLAKETQAGFPAAPQALTNLYKVAEPVARFLATDWAHTKAVIPG